MNQIKHLIALISSKGGERSEKVSLPVGEEITLGRAWNNDLIINDEYIDPEHLAICISNSGSIKIRDLNSRNGSRLNKEAIQDEQVYEDGSIIQLGETELRIYDAEHSVAPALPLDSAHLFSRRYNSAPVVAFLTLLALAALLAFLYFFDTEKFTADAAFSMLMAFSLIAIAWSFIAGFIGKLFRRETNIGSHWILVCLLTIGVVLVRLPMEVAKFNFDSPIINTLIDQSFIGLAIAAFSYATLSFCTRLSSKKKWTSALILALIPQIILAASPLLQEEREAWSAEADSQRLTQVPALMWRSSITVEAHLEKTDKLFDELIEEVENEN